MKINCRHASAATALCGRPPGTRRTGAWRRGCCLCALLLLAVLPVRASSSLDAVLSCLETNGVLTDRSEAVRQGLEGILKSIDPEASLGNPGDMTGVTNGVAAALEAVEFWPEEIVYLKVRGLGKGSGAELRQHLQALSDKAGIIVDLRGAGGDDLESVAQLAGVNRADGTPLFAVTDNQDKVLATNVVESSVFLRIPLMALVDHQTRGGAEALVALWRGCPGIMLIGSATRGEARFREAMTLPDGQAITMATRKIMPIQGAPYEGSGIKPDVVVAPGRDVTPTIPAGATPPSRPLSAKSEQDRDLMRRVGDDGVLQRATDILLGLRTLSGYGQQRN